MRIWKDKIFERKCAYNIVQLLDYLLSKIDLHYERKPVNFSTGKDNFLQMRYSLKPKKKEFSFEKSFGAEDCSIYIAKNRTKNKEYVVDCNLELCTCFVGSNGDPCKH